MLTFAILDYNRPIEAELCLKSIRKYTKFDDYEIIYLSNGGNQEHAIKFYQEGLIDKLILRKDNSGTGLATREIFNDFNLKNKYIAYIQCDQFMFREFHKNELDHYFKLLEENKYFYIDLAGNQGGGNPSERALLINKYKYREIPNDIGGPGPYANYKWSEQCFQEYIKDNNLNFLTTTPLFWDNGKVSRRQYPCGGELIQMTDEKSVFIIKPIKKRIDFPNLKLTDKEWESILDGIWIDGTVPELHKKDSFKCWDRPFNIKDIENV